MDAPTLSTLWTAVIGNFTTQWNGALPAVATAIGAVVAITVGVPLVIRFFKRNAK